jgi:Methyltransferase domain
VYGKAQGRPFVARVANYLHYRRIRFERDRTRPLRRRRIAAARAAAEAYFHATARRERLLNLFSKSKSTGAEITDYYLLHRYIRERRPCRVLEFGSGVTSLVMVDALADGGGGHLFSLENIPEYHDNVKSIIPADLAAHVTFLCSPRRETYWHNEIYGFCYSDLPPGRFDLVFVDGPTEYRDEEARRKGIKGANLDLLFLLERDDEARMDVIIDCRFSSQEAYQSVLPPGTVRYDAILDVGVIAGVSGRLFVPRHRPVLRGGNAWEMLGLSPGGALA